MLSININTNNTPCNNKLQLLFYLIQFLKDFEAMTPNLLARTIETVEGGGLVVILLRTMSSLKQFYTMSMVNLIFYFKRCNPNN